MSIIPTPFRITHHNIAAKRHSVTHSPTQRGIMKNVGSRTVYRPVKMHFDRCPIARILSMGRPSRNPTGLSADKVRRQIGGGEIEREIHASICANFHFDAFRWNIYGGLRRNFYRQSAVMLRPTGFRRQNAKTRLTSGFALISRANPELPNADRQHDRLKIRSWRKRFRNCGGDARRRERYSRDRIDVRSLIINRVINNCYRVLTRYVLPSVRYLAAIYRGIHEQLTDVYVLRMWHGVIGSQLFLSWSVIH